MDEIMASNSDEILRLAYFCFATYSKIEMMEKQPRDFGTGDLLTNSEVTTISAIGSHEAINVTSLARHFGISKSAASQMVRRLVEDGLVEKYHDAKNDKEILLRLTHRGKIAYLGHEHYHAKLDEQMLKNIGPMNDEDIRKLERFNAAIEAAIDAFIQMKD